MRVLFVALALAVMASTAHAQVWRGDFETGDLSQFSALNGTVMGQDYITVADDVVASGAHAGRIALHDDAVWPNGLKRVELHHSPAAGRTAEGASLYFAWSFYLPETLPTDPSQTIGYWESNTSYHQIMAFQLSGEDLTFYTQLPSYHAQWTGHGVIAPGVWHRIAMHVVWSQSASTGRVDAWLDGTEIVTALAVPTLADANEVFTQFGLLRGAIEFTDVPVIYIDDALEGDSLAEVMGDVLPMPDAGPPDAGSRPDAGRDAGTLDAASVDGGSARDVGVDAGASSIAGGCGCAVGHRTVSGLWVLGWIAVVLVRRAGRR